MSSWAETRGWRSGREYCRMKAYKSFWYKLIQSRCKKFHILGLENEEYSPHRLFFLARLVYLKWSKLLCIVTSWVRVETNCFHKKYTWSTHFWSKVGRQKMGVTKTRTGTGPWVYYCSFLLPFSLTTTLNFRNNNEKRTMDPDPDPVHVFSFTPSRSSFRSVRSCSLTSLNIF